MRVSVGGEHERDRAEHTQYTEVTPLRISILFAKKSHPLTGVARTIQIKVHALRAHWQGERSTC